VRTVIIPELLPSFYGQYVAQAVAIGTLT